MVLPLVPGHNRERPRPAYHTEFSDLFRPSSAPRRLARHSCLFRPLKRAARPGQSQAPPESTKAGARRLLMILASPSRCVRSPPRREIGLRGSAMWRAHLPDRPLGAWAASPRLVAIREPMLSPVIWNVARLAAASLTRRRSKLPGQGSGSAFSYCCVSRHQACVLFGPESVPLGTMRTGESW